MHTAHTVFLTIYSHISNTNTVACVILLLLTTSDDFAFILYIFHLMAHNILLIYFAASHSQEIGHSQYFSVF